MAKKKLIAKFPAEAYMILLDDDETVTFEDITELSEYLNNEGMDPLQKVGKYILNEVGTIHTETVFKLE